jgi:hypothetical protein
VPASFLDEVGKTVARVVPQAGPNISSEAQLKKVIAVPEGRLQVATVDAELARVIFTTTSRSPRPASGLLDQLGKAMEDVRKRFFGP